MNDKKYFLEYTKSFNMIFSSSDDDYVYIKDVNFKYQTVTIGMAKLFGSNSVEEVLGKTIVEITRKINLNDSEVVQKLVEQDLQIQQHKKRKMYLQVIFFNGNSRI